MEHLLLALPMPRFGCCSCSVVLGNQVGRDYMRDKTNTGGLQAKQAMQHQKLPLRSSFQPASGLLRSIYQYGFLHLSLNLFGNLGWSALYVVHTGARLYHPKGHQAGSSRMERPSGKGHMQWARGMLFHQSSFS